MFLHFGECHYKSTFGRVGGHIQPDLRMLVLFGAAMWAEVLCDEFLCAIPCILCGDVPPTSRRGKAAEVGAAFVRAGFALNENVVWVQRSKPFGQLRPKEGESGHAAESRRAIRFEIIVHKRGGVNQRRGFSAAVRVWMSASPACNYHWR